MGENITMSEFVKIIYGDSPIVVPSRTFDKMCIIGATTGDIGVVDEVKAQDLDPNNITIEGLVATDALYKAAIQFFRLNPSGTLVLAGVQSGTPDVMYFVEMAKIADYIWASGYSPVTAITNIEVYATDTEVLDPGDENAWYAITDGAVETVTNGVKPGTIGIAETGISFTSGTAYTNYQLADGDRLRVTVTPSALSMIFGGLTNPKINFEMFTIAYDSELPINNPVVAGDKYFKDECIGGEGWLHDVAIGIQMANQFNAVGQRTMFAYGYPEKAQPTEFVSTTLAAGTPYIITYDTETPPGIESDDTIQYEQLREKLGAHKFAMGFVTKQLAGVTAVDPGIAGIASLSKFAKRSMLTFYPEAIANDEWPNGSERVLWRRAQVNSFIYIKEGGGMVWGNNQTMGQGADADINHIRCKNILAYKISEALYTLLYARSLKYDINGTKTIRSTIAAVLATASGVYIDGPGKIVIPIEELLKREGSLSEGEITVLKGARASKKIDNIGVGYQWKGDIEFIYISALLAE